MVNTSPKQERHRGPEEPEQDACLESLLLADCRGHRRHREWEDLAGKGVLSRVRRQEASSSICSWFSAWATLCLGTSEQPGKCLKVTRAGTGTYWGLEFLCSNLSCVLSQFTAYPSLSLFFGMKVWAKTPLKSLAYDGLDFSAQGPSYYVSQDVFVLTM